MSENDSKGSLHVKHKKHTWDKIISKAAKKRYVADDVVLTNTSGKKNNLLEETNLTSIA